MRYRSIYLVEACVGFRTAVETSTHFKSYIVFAQNFQNIDQQKNKIQEEIENTP